MFATYLLVGLAFAGSLTDAARPAFPLKIAPNRRYLVDQKGRPFLVVGDSPWSLIVQPDEAGIDRYLQDRARRGFNAVIVNLLEHRFCTHPPRTRAGIAPFPKAGDFATPSPAYFDFAYRVVQKANDRGIAVWLFPAYLGSGGGNEGWFQELKAAGPAKLRRYGQFVGQRFKGLPNVVWALGGDFTPALVDQWTVTAVAEGIRTADPQRLMTAHGAPASHSAVAAFGEPPWLTVNAVYSYEKTLFRPLQDAYHHQPARPFVLLETVYEGEHDAKPEEIRRQAYWALLSGACGQFFGNNPLWHFDGPGLYPAQGTWQQALDGTGSRDMARLRRVFAAMRWHDLVPERDHTLVTDGYGQGAATALTARTTDGRQGVTYLPSTGTASRALTVDLGRFTGPVTARWYNPTDGRYTAISAAPLPNHGPHTLRTPGDNGTRTNDWLLVLQVH
jgi:hypothetical protein